MFTTVRCRDPILQRAGNKSIPETDLRSRSYGGDESVDTEAEDLGGDTTVVARLLERAQCGEHDEVLRLAENALKEPTGDLADGDAGMHFVRFVALGVLGRSSEAMGAIDLMLQASDREGSQGWRSCALSGRAYQRLLMGDQLAEHAVEAVLQDLVDAELALGRGVEDSVIAEHAHTGVALGYHQLRTRDEITSFLAAKRLWLCYVRFGGVAG